MKNYREEIKINEKQSFIESSHLSLDASAQNNCSLIEISVLAVVYILKIIGDIYEIIINTFKCLLFYYHCLQFNQSWFEMRQLSVNSSLFMMLVACRA